MRLLIVLIKLIRLFIGYFIKPIVILGYKIYFYKIDKLKPLKPSFNPLLFLSATELARRIRNKEITSLELVQTYINRINEIQPLLNCVVFTCFEEAIEQAKNVDQILASKKLSDEYSEQNAPLLGVPFTCKESFWVKGLPCTSGLVCRKDFRAPEDADVVRNMRKAGAILVCLTNTSELCMWFESSNRLYGISRNAYNLSRIVGGSSGGEACLIGGSGAVIGIGADIGGSIRMPAYFNGIYGHKPTPNVISNYQQHPAPQGIQERMIGTGPLCRYASDLRLLFKIFAGSDTFSRFQENFERHIDFSRVNFYVIEELNSLFTSPVSPSCKEALNKGIHFVETQFGVKVNRLELKKMKYAFNIWSAMMSNGKSTSKNFSDLMTDHSKTYKLNPYWEFLKSIFGKSKHTLPAIFLAVGERAPIINPEKLIQKGEELREELNTILGQNGILLFPGFPIVSPYHHQSLITNTFDFMYYGIFNAMGFPVTQIPMGLCPKTGLPTGIQLVARPFNDHLTIKLAEYFEKNLIGWVPPF